MRVDTVSDIQLQEPQARQLISLDTVGSLGKFLPADTKKTVILGGDLCTTDRHSTRGGTRRWHI